MSQRTSVLGDKPHLNDIAPVSEHPLEWLFVYGAFLSHGENPAFEQALGRQVRMLVLLRQACGRRKNAAGT